MSENDFVISVSLQRSKIQDQIPIQPFQNYLTQITQQNCKAYHKFCVPSYTLE